MYVLRFKRDNFTVFRFQMSVCGIAYFYVLLFPFCANTNRPLFSQMDLTPLMLLLLLPSSGFVVLFMCDGLVCVSLTDAYFILFECHHPFSPFM